MKDYLWTLFLMMVAMFFGVWIGMDSGEQKMQRKAIQAGVGEYYISNTNIGWCEFRWVTNRVSVGADVIMPTWKWEK